MMIKISRDQMKEAYSNGLDNYIKARKLHPDLDGVDVASMVVSGVVQSICDNLGVKITPNNEGIQKVIDELCSVALLPTLQHFDVEYRFGEVKKEIDGIEKEMNNDDCV